MNTLTSSVVICQALGKSPDGVAARHEDSCVYCGKHIAVGDLCTPFMPSSTFTDANSLVNKGGELACGFCSVLMGPENLMATGYGVFSSDGALPFRKWADVSKALTSPPSSAFVMVYATAKNQHMAWRAPVNHSRDLFYVRVGLRDLKIRRPLLLSAIQTAQRMGETLGRKSTPKTLAHPFSGLSPDLKDHKTGFLSDKVFSECAPQDVQEILSLTTGELWALRFLLSPGAGLAKEDDEEQSEKVAA